MVYTVVVSYDSLMKEDIWDVNLFESTNVFVEDKIIDVLDLSAEMADVGEVWNRVERLWLRLLRQRLLLDEVASSSEECFEAVEIEFAENDECVVDFFHVDQATWTVVFPAEFREIFHRFNWNDAFWQEHEFRSEDAEITKDLFRARRFTAVVDLNLLQLSRGLIVKHDYVLRLYFTMHWLQVTRNIY